MIQIDDLLTNNPFLRHYSTVFIKSESFIKSLIPHKTIVPGFEAFSDLTDVSAVTVTLSTGRLLNLLLKANFHGRNIELAIALLRKTGTDYYYTRLPGL